MSTRPPTSLLACPPANQLPANLPHDLLAQLPAHLPARQPTQGVAHGAGHGRRDPRGLPSLRPPSDREEVGGPASGQSASRTAGQSAAPPDAGGPASVPCRQLAEESF